MAIDKLKDYIKKILGWLAVEKLILSQEFVDMKRKMKPVSIGGREKDCADCQALPKGTLDEQKNPTDFCPKHAWHGVDYPVPDIPTNDIERKALERFIIRVFPPWIAEYLNSDLQLSLDYEEAKKLKNEKKILEAQDVAFESAVVRAVQNILYSAAVENIQVTLCNRRRTALANEFGMLGDLESAIAKAELKDTSQALMIRTIRDSNGHEAAVKVAKALGYL